MTAITRDDWLKALSDAGLHDDEDDQSALTVPEFMALTQMPRHTADRKLEALVRAGKANRTQKWATSPDGRRMKYLAFKLV